MTFWNGFFKRAAMKMKGVTTPGSHFRAGGNISQLRPKANLSISGRVNKPPLPTPMKTPLTQNTQAAVKTPAAAKLKPIKPQKVSMT